MKRIYGLCMIVGLILTIGIAGGSDCGILTFKQVVLYTTASTLITLVGFAGLKTLEEDRKDEQILHE